jgi:hypothetical protein
MIVFCILLENVCMRISGDEPLLDVFDVVVVMEFGWVGVAKLAKHMVDY